MLLCQHFIYNKCFGEFILLFVLIGCAIFSKFLCTFPWKVALWKQCQFTQCSKVCGQKKKNRIILVWFSNTIYIVLVVKCMNWSVIEWRVSPFFTYAIRIKWLFIHSAILFTHVDITPSTQYTIVNFARGPTCAGVCACVFFCLSLATSFPLMKRKYLFHDSHP